MYNGDNLNSLVGFLALMGYRRECVIVPCTPLVYFVGAFCSFFFNILLFTYQKKKIIYIILNY